MTRQGLSRLRATLASQQLRYLLVGGYNTVVGYLLFAVPYAVFGDRVHYLVLLVVAHVVSVLNAFVAYRVFVFRVRGKVVRDLLRFWSVYAAALAVNLVALPFAVGLGAPVLPAQAGFVVATIVTTYVLNARFSFHRGDYAAGADAQEAGTSSKSTTVI